MGFPAIKKLLDRANKTNTSVKYDQKDGFYISQIFSKSSHGIFSIRILVDSWDSILQGATFRFWAYFQRQDFFSGEMCDKIVI